VKKIARSFITALLSFKAKRFLKKHRIQVIAVTGSIGKTSTKQAIYTLLKTYFNVYASPHGFNTPLGLSLAVFQEEESGFSSVRAWWSIIQRAFAGKQKIYSKIILEMGADSPGDIKKLTSIACPSIGVITCVAEEHLDPGQFADIRSISKEKNTLIKNLTRGGLAILNDDDLLVRAMETPAIKFTYGTQVSADLQATEIKATSKHLKFEVHFKNQTVPFAVPILGKFQIYVLLPAIAVGMRLGLTLEQCAHALRDFRLPPGRMNPIEGLKGVRIIDSSYNASPTSMASALDLLDALKAERKVAVIGTMNELGDITETAHVAIGRKAGGIAELLITVGPEAAMLKKGALQAGLADENIYTFFDSEEAGHFLKNRFKKGDLILVKGSQNRVRLERLVKMIMKAPAKAGALLCRQETAWSAI
jgi:UDP-N-acetylmuramyl pentapeptide synthase